MGDIARQEAAQRSVSPATATEGVRGGGGRAESARGTTHLCFQLNLERMLRCPEPALSQLLQLVPAPRQVAHKVTVEARLL